MDRLRKARRPLRANITRLVNQAELLFEQENPDKTQLKIILAQSQPYWNALDEQDQKIMDQLLDDDAADEDITTESNEVGRYFELYQGLRVKLQEVLEPAVSVAESVMSDASATGSRHDKKRSFQLPKFKMMKFNGDLKKWLGWWSQFRKIHEDQELDDADKFHFLFDAMEEGSKAYEVVASYTQSAENYEKAVEALQETFGRDDLQLQFYVRELLTLVISNVSSKEKMPLPTLFLKLESHLRCLQTLKLDQADPATWLFPLVESSLSNETLRAWQRSALSKVDGASQNPIKSRLDLLMDFIRLEVRTEQQIVMAQSAFQTATISENPKNRGKGKAAFMKNNQEVSTAAGLLSGQLACGFCDGKHDTDRCFKAQTMQYAEKKEKLQSKNLCYRCFYTYHGKEKCKIPVRCILCGSGHHSLMCHKGSSKKSDDQSKVKPVESGKGTESTQPIDEATKTSSAANLCTSEVLLNIVHVKILGDGKTTTARLVGDPGSQRSYIRQKFVKDVGLKQVDQEYIQNVLFGGVSSQPCRTGRYAVKLASLNSNKQIEVELLEKATICGALPRVPQGPWLTELQKKGIQISDVGPGSSEVDILIGNDIWQDLLTGKRIKLESGFYALETIFGWTLGGRVPVVSSNLAVTVTSSLLSTTADISHMWSLEAIGISDPIEVQSKEEEEAVALKHFRENVKRDNEGRYVVALPWKTSTKLLPTNRAVAEKRLQRATQQLHKAEKFKLYDAVFQGWEKEGMIVTVQDNQKGHYLPHRPVFKDSATTPVRPVFDASCKVGKFPSLNDCLYKGPNLLELIPALLLRFREKPVGVSADIRKAFQMICVREEDQPYQRFLWWTDATCKKVKVFQHLRVVFGMNCSPFLLAATISHHLITNSDNNLARELLLSFYVDNLVQSVTDLSSFVELRRSATSVMKDACMELRQWARTLGKNDSREFTANELSDEEETTMSLLGLVWDRRRDTLSCVIPKVELETKFTKKLILSLVARIFDPIGFLCPALVLLKSLIQESWAAEYGWDEILPVDYQTRMQRWMKSISQLELVHIPRMFGFQNFQDREIHVFVDASSTAYAGVVFLRTECAGAVAVQLILAKSRLAPKKKSKKEGGGCLKATIPRLELMSCVLGTRLVTTVCGALSLKNIPVRLWTDSTVARAWIERHDQYGVFVGNRVEEIRKTTSPSQWRHVPGHMNPADLPSRGCTPSELMKSSWWEGTNWLKEGRSSWPNFVEEVDEEAVSEEKKKSAVLVATCLPILPLRFSSYRKNVAVYGWVLRFVNNSRKKAIINSKILGIDELERAEKILLKNLQMEVFPVVSDVVGNLSVSKGEDGLLRVKTRIVNRTDTSGFLSPILLPKCHPLVNALINDFHRYHGHGGVNFIREKIREKYWVINSRRVVGKTIKSCIICRRHSAQPLNVEPAPLPDKRTADCDPFSTTGVDLAGPLYLKNKDKAWIVIYTCSVYRCVHLDLVMTISTEAFLQSLERFIATYGRPNTIFSDNGTNFVGAANLFLQVDWKKVETESAVKQIQWTFNPPTAAWWGGWWERLIRSVKDLLKRMLGRSKLTYDQLRTCLSGVAATINDRPLTVVTESNGDLHALSPSMFIRPLRVGHFPEVERERGLSERYRMMKEIQRQLQERFRKEYLSLLIMPVKKGQVITPVVGDVVLVGADNKRRFEWPLGVIEELFPGGDGNVRVAKVKTATGFFERPLQRLYPLEVTSPRDLVEAELPIEVKTPEEAQPKVIKTRRGRLVQKPTRYGQWSR